MLTDASTFLRSSLSSREIEARLVELAASLFRADAAAIWRVDHCQHAWIITTARGLSETFVATTTGESATLHDLLQAPFVVGDVDQWDPARSRQALFHEEGIRAFLVLPLEIRGEMASASIVCYYRAQPALSEEDIAYARAYASVASNALSGQKVERLATATRRVSAELDLEPLVQSVTDAATELTGAAFGAFFYNVVDAGGESYMLYAISGVPREAFSRFPMPRNTEVFAPTFNGTATVRSANIQKDPRYGKNAPHHGMPQGHLPVKSYLAVPVISRSGEVLGGLFFGHPDEGVFTEVEERIVEGLAAQASIGIDNARLYRSAQQDRARLGRDEKRYRSLILATPTPQAFGIATPDGNLVEASGSWFEITGQTPEEFRDGGWLATIHEADREAFQTEWTKAVAGHDVFQKCIRIRLADGSYRWFEAKSVPVYDEEGQVGEWVGTITDVHEAKTSEDMLRFLAKTTELFATSLDTEQTLKTLTALAVPEIADWCSVDMFDDPETIRRIAIAHVDPAKVELAWEMARRYPPQLAQGPSAEVIRTGRSVLLPSIEPGMIEQFARDDEHRRMLIELKIMSAMIVPLQSRGRVFGLISFIASDSQRRFTDFDLRRAEEFARRASVAVDNARLYGAAQSANRAKDEFLATLSHELRTPMTAVLGWARMLKLGLTEVEAVEAVEAIERSAEIQAQLIDDILDVSRIMSGKLRMDAQPVDLRTIVNAALVTVHPAADAKNIEMLTSFAPALPPISGDEGRLQQVVWNLLSNAIKFTPKGGTVTVRIGVVGSLLRLTVQDTGQGIEAAFLPHVFEPFHQADSSTTRMHGGIGLGLAIVRYLVQLHGGSVSASSDGKNRGATFTVDLPVIEAAPFVSPRRMSAREAAAAGQPLELPSLDGLNVLAIDDQDYTRDVVAAILRRCGANVVTSASVREGLGALAASAPDVIVCDIAMPDEDGYAFLRELRALPDERFARLPVIALTAFGRAEDRENALAAGFTGYLKKPVEPHDLATAVKQVRRSSTPSV